MKKGLILVNAFYVSDSVKKQSTALKEEFLRRGVDVDIKQINEAAIYIEKGDIVNKYQGYDFCLFLDKDKHISHMLEKIGLKLFNNPDAIEDCDDKMLTYIKLSNNGILMPKTISSPLCYFDANTKAFQDKVLEELGLPLIIKQNYGSLGKQVYKIESKEEFYKVSTSLKYLPHLYQSFIASSEGKDIRVILINHQVVAAMERKNPNDFRSNIALGGHGTKIDKLDPRFEETAIKASEILNLDYCGVDIMIGENGEPILCEVNSNAFFNEISKVTGIDVCKKLVDYLMTKI
jgi:ribosomal protein S6--L-glutamate ligase/gamma-F420-2:alpha-L-glutamate ligase